MKIAIAMLAVVALAGCRYQLEVAGGSTMAEDRVWVLDTFTGRVSLCYETAARIGCLEPNSAPR